ncbi:MAG: Hsp20/alpha crystallin family protein [Balneolaceae bacterium]|nr:Hsp20/alpha crystallin family protein [Balneolaceae bacterium]
MGLIKYSRPDSDILSRSFDDLFNEFFSNTPSYKRDGFMPSVDISESEKQFELSVELPGMKKEDIKIDLENGRLTISGERKFKNEENEKNYHRVESRFGTFTRTFHLPDSIDEDTIAAKYTDGILNITIDKSEDKVKKQIEIA